MPHQLAEEPESLGQAAIEPSRQLPLVDTLRRYPSLLVLISMIFGYLFLEVSPQVSLSIGLLVGLPLLLSGLFTPQKMELSSWCRLRSVLFGFGLFVSLVALWGYRKALPEVHLPEPLIQWASEQRDYALERGQTLGLSPEGSSLSAAIALGYNPRANEGMRTIKELFRRSGAAHILVLSGMHISLVVALLTALLPHLPLLRWRWRLRAWLTIALVGLFVLLTGAGIPSLRAWLCLSLYLVGRMLGKHSLALGLLYTSACIQLALSPSLLHSWSFLLSYTAVLSIHLFRYPLMRLMPPPQMPLLSFLHQQVILMLSAQVLTLPLGLMLFGTSSWSFIFASIPLSLLCVVYIPLSLGYYLLSYLGLGLYPLTWAVEQVSSWMLGISQWGAQLPYMQIEGSLPLWAYLLYSAAAIALALRWRAPAQGEDVDWERYYKYY